MPGAWPRVAGDLAPSGLFTVSPMPSPSGSVTVRVGGIDIAPSGRAGSFRVPPFAAPGTEITIASGSLSRAFEVADPGPATWVFLLAGQSNMVCRAAADASTWAAGVSYVTRESRPIAPSASMMSAAGDTGPFLIAKRFAADFLESRPEDRAVLVPGAVGGTSFSNNRWNPGDDLYEELVATTQAVLSAHPTWRLRAMLFQGFETDGQNCMPAATFGAALERFVESIRTDLQAAQLPIIFGEMPAGFVGSNPDRIAIRDEVLLAPSRLAYTAVASSRLPSVAADDGLHFTQAGSLLIGGRYAPALAAADANTFSQTSG
jgi:Carbohydrate esterase, sialic acid-specific acetylesterase